MENKNFKLKLVARTNSGMRQYAICDEVNYVLAVVRVDQNGYAYSLAFTDSHIGITTQRWIHDFIHECEKGQEWPCEL